MNAKAKSTSKFQQEIANYKKELSIQRVCGRIVELAEAIKDGEDAWYINDCRKYLVKCIAQKNAIA